MTRNALIDAIIVIAEEVAEQLWMMNSSDGTAFDDGDPDTDIRVKQPTVYPYKIPPNQSADPFPFIIVRPMSGHDEQVVQNNTARVLIGVGGYSQDVEGYKEVLWLIEAMRYRLATTMLITAGCGVRESLDDRIYWGDADQPIPQWQGEIEVEYKVPGAQFNPEWSDS